METFQWIWVRLLVCVFGVCVCVCMCVYGGVCVCIIEPLCCTPEIDMVLLIDYTLIF